MCASDLRLVRVSFAVRAIMHEASGVGGVEFCESWCYSNDWRPWSVGVEWEGGRLVRVSVAVTTIIHETSGVGGREVSES